MDPEKAKQIGWFMNFLNIDYDKASFEERYHLLQDMNLTFGRCLHSDFSDHDSPSLNREMRGVLLSEKGETVKRLQSKLINLLDGLNQNIHKIKNSQGKVSEALNIEEVENLQTLGRINVVISDVKIMVEKRPKIVRHPEHSQMWKAYWPDGTLDDSAIRLEIIPKEDDEGFVFTFFGSIEGMPLSFIRRCGECDKWFVQRSKHEQIFCSVNCRARKNVRAWRTTKKTGELGKRNDVRKIRFPKSPEKERED